MKELVKFIESIVDKSLYDKKVFVYPDPQINDVFAVLSPKKKTAFLVFLDEQDFAEHDAGAEDFARLNGISWPLEDDPQRGYWMEIG